MPPVVLVDACSTTRQAPFRPLDANCTAVRPAQVLLYDWEDGYPWAKLPQSAVHPNIQVVRNWGEVETALAALAVPQQP